MKRIHIGLLLLIVATPILAVNAETKFALDVSKGIIPGHEGATDIGHNHAVGTTEAHLWNGPTLVYPWLDAATLINVTSSDIDDTVLGSGARIVQIFGLDENYNMINETLAMNGQNNATTTLEYLRINLAQVIGVGTQGGSNEGDIYFGSGPIVAGVQNTAYEFIDANFGRSHTSSYTVPANHTFFATSTLYTIHIGSSKEVETTFNIRFLGVGVNRTRWRAFQFHSSNLALPRPFDPPIALPATTDIFFTGETDVGTASISVDIIGDLVRNDSFEVPDEASASNNMLLYLMLTAFIMLGLGFTLRGKRR